MQHLKKNLKKIDCAIKDKVYSFILNRPQLKNFITHIAFAFGYIPKWFFDDTMHRKEAIKQSVCTDVMYNFIELKTNESRTDIALYITEYKLTLLSIYKKVIKDNKMDELYYIWKFEKNKIIN